MQPSRAAFLIGLFLATLATLALEILDTRLLSVVTWYHLSFFAVSTALFGMSAGSLRVYLGGERYAQARAPAALARAATGLALAIPASHAVALVIPVPPELTATSVAALAALTGAIAIPFYLSGVVVALALTRIPAPSGRVYAVDLLGAALGSVSVLALLALADLSSATLVCGALAALSASCFHAFAGSRRGARAAAALALALFAAAVVNARSPERGLRLSFYKTGMVPRGDISDERWTIHGQVSVRRPATGRPWYWGAGAGTDGYRVERVSLLIDGAAATVMTRWDGDPAALAWVAHDVTSLGFHLRPGGSAAVIGVGGGRDLLTAIWAHSRRITGIEVNRAFLDLLQGRFRDFAGLADRSELRLVHDEARAFLTRSDERYDLIQMSLIDTWAATGAGAFTLTENGLYTVEAWQVLLDALAPDGLLSVSRWHNPDSISESSRLLSLATASLLARGVAEPARHLALVSAGRVATLLVSPEPLQAADLQRLRAVSQQLGFAVLMAPAQPPADPLMRRIRASRSPEALEAAVAGQPYDYSPPTDRRPYFFNLLRPAAFLRGLALPAGVGTVTSGNIQATSTLVVLWILSALLVALVIFVPLVRVGLPQQGRASFAGAALYFALIGAGFMLVQIPLVQRFSVYLGHPTHAVSVVLFSMILTAGAGSLVSDRIPVERRRGWLVAIPLAIAALLVVVALVLQPLIDATLKLDLLGRCALAVAVVAPPAFLMGMCLPFGLRLVRRVAEPALPWMWGINGATSVLAAVSAVGISLSWGIDANLALAAACYALLALPAVATQRRGSAASLALLLACAGLLGCGGDKPPVLASPRVVLIIVDTLRADHLSLYGHSRATSPFLDRAARAGRVYERAFATSSWTLPSVASLLTGLNPEEHRAGTVILKDGKKPFLFSGAEHFRSLRPGVVTLTQRLQSEGLATAAFITNSFLDRRFGLDAGFDLYDWSVAVPEGSRPASRTVDRVLDWLAKHRDEPFFLVVHFFDPHLDYDAPKPARGRFTGGVAESSLRLPVGIEVRDRLAQLGDADREFIRAAYDEEILAIDRQLARLLGALQQSGVMRDGLVILTADHGEELMEHAGFEHGHALWQPVLQVPLVLWGSGVRPGRELAPVSLVDVAPTVLDAVGIAAQDELAGSSLWPNATREQPLAARAIRASGTLYGPRRRALLLWPYKLVDSVETGEVALYDLDRDPGESQDLAAAEPERAARMLAELRAHFAHDEDPDADAGLPAPPLDPETQRSLKELGYLE